MSLESFADIPVEEGKCLKDFFEFENMNYWWYDEVAIHLDTSYDDYAKLNFFKTIQYNITKYCNPMLAIIDLVSKGLLTVVDILNKDKIVEGLNLTPLIFLKNDGNRWRYLCDSKNNILRYKPQDYMEVLDKFDSSWNPVIIYDDLPRPSLIVNYWKIKKYYDGKVIPLVRFWKLNVWNKEKRAIRYAKEVYAYLLKKTQWITECSTYLNISEKRFKEILKYHCLCSFPLCVRHYELLNNLMLKQKPDLLFIACEHTYLSRGWLYVAKKFEIPSIAIQHGISPDGNKNYFKHTEYDVSTESLLKYPIPDLTLVWGEIDRTLLIEKAYYPPDKVVTVGNPHYDMHINNQDYYSRDLFFQKHGLRASDKIVLWLTQSHVFTESEIIRYATAICKGVIEIENIVLVIKPHPLEGRKYVQIITETCLNYGIRFIYLDSKSSATEAIYNCDICVITSSTTGQEAVIFGKPLICLDFSQTPDYANYVKEGVATGVFSDETSLTSTILHLLSENSIDCQKRNEFISKYLFKLDGLSANRCVDIIRRELRR